MGGSPRASRVRLRMAMRASNSSTLTGSRGRATPSTPRVSTGHGFDCFRSGVATKRHSVSDVVVIP